MKKLLLLLLFLPIAFSALDCSSLDPTSLGSVSAEYSVNGDIDLIYYSEHSIIENIIARIKIVPQTGFTSTSFTGELEYDELNNLFLNYSNPIQSSDLSQVSWNFEGVYSYETSNIKVANNPVFPYPINQFPEEVLTYLEFSEIADNSIAIQLKVNELISGVVDYFTAVSEIAEFVAYHVEYANRTKSLFYSSQIQASEVFEQGLGVCDEYSSLLVSMLRNVGIPARFVNGFSYTNLGVNTCTNFGAHSWVEFYIPNYGWAPLDATYKEFFTLDAGHIPLYKNADGSNQLISGGIINVNSNFTINSPTFNIELTDYSLPTSDLSLSASFNVEKLGEDNYALLTVTVTNPHNEWVLDTLRLVTTNEMQVVYNNKTIPIVLPPNSDSEFYFITYITPGISESCFINQVCELIYPVIVNLNSGGQELLNITISPTIVGISNPDSLLNLIQSETRIYSSDMIISNAMISPSVVVDENPTLSFNIQNVGNTQLNDLNVIIDYDDFYITQSIGSLFIGQIIEYSRELELPSEPGVIEVDVYVSSGNLTVPFSETFSIVARAPFTLTSTGVSEYTSEDDYELTLDFSSIPSNYLEASIKILVNDNEVINRPYYFSTPTFDIPKSEFETGDNIISVILEYNDASGNEYRANSELIVNSSVNQTIIDIILSYIQAIIDIFRVLFS